MNRCAKCLVSLIVLFSGFEMAGQTKEYELKFNEKGYPYIECTLSQYGTLYNLSKTFSIPLSRITDANSIVDPSEIAGDKVLYMPINTSYIKNGAGENRAKLVYVVKPGETLYRISKTYFNRSVSDVSSLNDLEGSNISVGKKIVIGYYLPENELDKLEEEEDDIASELKPVEAPNVVWVKERAIASWNQVQMKGGRKFVLHNTAKLNTEIEIYNPLMRRTIHAKVVGRIPEGTYAKDVDVLVSPAVAQSLGALDARFMVEIKYAIPAEDQLASMK